MFPRFASINILSGVDISSSDCLLISKSPHEFIIVFQHH
jgi:hypothetical protein